MKTSSIHFLPALLILTLAPTIHAQTAAGIRKAAPATTGKTEVTTEGFDAVVKADPEKDKDTTEMKLSAGGQFASGNARQVAVTGATTFRARRGANQLSIALAGNYAEAAAKKEADLAPTVANVQGKTRYDRFIYSGLAGFLSVSARNDRFQGLNLRLNFDPGLAYYFVDQEKHRLWGEFGYDLQSDFRRSTNIREAAAKGETLEPTEVRHSGRLFGGYENNLNAMVTLSTGLEYIQSIQDSKYWRLNWDVGLTSKLVSNLSFAATFALRYDHSPLAGVEKTDTVTAANLVYTVL